MNKDTIDKMYLFSGENKNLIRTFFESLISIIMLDYMEGEETNIPFFGTIKIEYEKDEIIDGEKEAKVSLDFTPDPTLLKNVGQINDGEESDVKKMIILRMREAIRKYL